MSADAGALVERRLRGWKEIGTYLGVDQRSAKRWEVLRGLPVHRVPGDTRAPVYAFETELAAWLRQQKGEAASEPLPAPPVEPAQTEHRQRWPWVLLGLVIAALLAVLLWPRSAPSMPDLPTTARGRALWQEAEYALSTRHRDGITLANQRYTELVAAEPRFAPGVARLAVSYNMLAQYDLMPSGQAYARAVGLADQALVLRPNMAMALAARGFARFYGARDVAGAMMDLQSAAERPDAAAETHQWLALISMHGGDQRLALKEIARAAAMDPQSRAIQANHGLILMHAGRHAEAEAMLLRLHRLDSGLTSPILHLASLYLLTGRWAQHVDMLKALARLRNNPVQMLQAEALGKALATGGSRAMLMLRRQQISPDARFAQAGAEALLGNADAAFRQLDSALAAEDPHTIGIMVEVTLASLRRDPRFAARAAQAGFTPAALARLRGAA